MGVTVIATVLSWTLFWALMFATYLYERYLRSLMEPDPSLEKEPQGGTDSMEVKGVTMSWSRQVSHSPWEGLTWEEKMAYLYRRSLLNWATALTGMAVLVSFVFYARDEMELIRKVTEGKAPEVALDLVNRPEVIIWLVVMAVALAGFAAVRLREAARPLNRIH